MGIPILNTAVGGPEAGKENEDAFLANIGGLADYAAERNVTITLEIHGELTSTGRKSRILLEKVNRSNVKINYDTANCEYYGAVRAEDDLPYALPLVALCHLKDKIGGAVPGISPRWAAATSISRSFSACFAAGAIGGHVAWKSSSKGNPWPPLDVVNRALKKSYRHLTGLGLS